MNGCGQRRRWTPSGRAGRSAATRSATCTIITGRPLTLLVKPPNALSGARGAADRRSTFCRSIAQRRMQGTCFCRDTFEPRRQQFVVIKNAWHDPADHPDPYFDRLTADLALQHRLGILPDWRHRPVACNRCHSFAGGANITRRALPPHAPYPAVARTKIWRTASAQMPESAWRPLGRASCLRQNRRQG